VAFEFGEGKAGHGGQGGCRILLEDTLAPGAKQQKARLDVTLDPKSRSWGITEIGLLGRETGVEGLGAGKECRNLKFEI
jgi:hypothetical protein